MILAGATDNELLKMSLAGSRDAFGQIVERYQCLVCTVSYSVTGNLALSEDIAQETFLAAWQGLPGLKDLGRFRAWLCGIARNLARNASRRGRQGISGRTVSLATAAEPAAAAAEPIQQVVSSEEQEVLWQALERIPETYREPLVLYYREAQSVPRVAEALELSADAVKQRLLRGRKLLKRQVAQFVEETLAKTRPSKMLTVAIVAALPAAAPQAAVAGVLAAEGSAAAKTAAFFGLSWTVLGPIVGVVGGLFGATMSLVHARSPRERRFLLLLAAGTVIYVGAFLGVLLGTIWNARAITARSSTLFGALLAGEMVLYGAGLIAAIGWGNRRLRGIRKEEGLASQCDDIPVGKDMSTFSFTGALFGSVFGSVAWLLGLAWSSSDWMAFTALLAATTCVCGLSVLARERWRHRTWHIVAIAVVAVFALSVLAVLFRWDLWFGRPALAGGPPLRSERLTLSNGIRVVVLPMAGTENVSIFTYAPLGLATDGPGQSQWSHLVEHLIIRSTAPQDSTQFNAETLPDHMRLDFYGNLENWREGLSHHARWLRGEPFRGESLEAEKTKVVAECDFTAQKLATHKFALAAWAQAHRHGQPRVAMKGDARRASLAELEEHRRKHLAVRDRIVVCVAGGVTRQQIEKEVVRQLGGIACRANIPAKVQQRTGEHDVTWDLDARHLVLTWPIRDAPSADLAALVVAGQLLTMRAASDPELGSMTGMVLAGADLTTPEGRFFYVSASLRPKASIERVQALLERHVAALASEDAGHSSATMVASALAQQLLAPPDPAVVARSAGPGIARSMLEGNIGLVWGMLEFRYGPDRPQMGQWMTQVDHEAVRRAAARLLKTGGALERLALSNNDGSPLGSARP